MNASEKIKHLTGRTPVEVREWAFVYWVKFSTGRPTMYSKKMVDRAAHITVIAVASSDAILKDEKTGVAYVTRSNWQLGHSIKELTRGQAIDLSSFDYSTLAGQKVAETPHVRKPSRVSELISMVAAAA